MPDWLLPIITGLGSSLGGLFGGSQKETPIQGQQRQAIDDILKSISGEGPYSNLFQANNEDFEKFFIEPAKQQFQSQIAPQIQQAYISSGQQRGTGLDDTLTRAGVDLDQMLNQFRFQQQQGAQKRQLSALERILGQKAGVAEQPSPFESLTQGLGGYFASPTFGEQISDIFFPGLENKSQNKNQPQTKGFES